MDRSRISGVKPRKVVTEKSIITSESFTITPLSPLNGYFGPFFRFQQLDLFGRNVGHGDFSPVSTVLGFDFENSRVNFYVLATIANLARISERGSS